MEILKSEKLSDMSLIYADFTGHYEKYVKPLLEYLSKNKDKLNKNLIVGITYSSNGVGDNKIRKKIERDIGRYTGEINMEEIDDLTENDYGNGGNMNVIFFKKC